MRETNKRCHDLRHALDKGSYSNGNHMINTGAGLIQDAVRCQNCPDNFRCFLAGKTIDPYDAIHKNYPCVDERRYIQFHYHGSCCITFDRRQKRVNDWGYWGYSVTTSRSIRWYLEALLYEGFIDSSQTVEDAIKFFKKRRTIIGSGDPTVEWFQC